MSRRSLLTGVARVTLVSLSVLPLTHVQAATWPEWGVALNITPYGNLNSGGISALRATAPLLGYGLIPGKILSVDSVNADQPNGFGMSWLLRYDIGSHFTLEANYAGEAALANSQASVYITGTGTSSYPPSDKDVVQRVTGAADIQVTRYGLALLGYWPVKGYLNVQGRVGASRFVTNVDTTTAIGPDTCGKGICGQPASVNSASIAPVFGVGLAFRVPRFGRVGFEYQRTLTFGNAHTTGRYSIQNFGLDFSYTVNEPSP